MPAKNVSLYVGQAVNSLRRANQEDWELVVVEDHSKDDTYDVLKRAEETDSRIKVHKNKGDGKVDGLNYGYTLTSGETIKCIDADDVLDERFFGHIDRMSHCDALCHDSYITASDLRILGNYSVDTSILSRDFSYCLKYMKSLPRWTWTFTRNIGDKVFPMPANLPFEDVWFSLVIKKYAKRICYVKENLYHYRQHDNQTFGGILNFDSEIVMFRAQRMLAVIDVIENEETGRLVDGTSDADLFDEMRCFYGMLARQNVNLRNIVKCDVPLEFRAKLLLYKKLPFLAPLTVRLKWRLDKKRRAADKPGKNLAISDESRCADHVDSQVK
jgi:glycosyltransferase involved in cell wall biosynthesis